MELKQEITDAMYKLLLLKRRGLMTVTLESLSHVGKPMVQTNFDVFCGMFPDVTEPVKVTEGTYGENDEYSYSFDVYEAEYDGIVFTALKNRY
jgi:hypothetical protein